MSKHKHVKQHEANMGDPSEHFRWALTLMPTGGAAGAITHPYILAQWSEHLHAAGFRHVDHIAELANDEGFIHVSQLPRQRIRLQEAVMGPKHNLNAAARWVPIDQPDPEPQAVMEFDQKAALEYEAKQRHQSEFVDHYAPTHDSASVE